MKSKTIKDWVVDFFISQYFFDDIHIPQNVNDALIHFMRMNNKEDKNG